MTLSVPERLNLLKFVCSFCWTDLKIAQAERDLVMRIVGQMNLTDDEAKQVRAWLQVPPPVDEIDPSSVPKEHRELFLRAAQMAIAADGRVVPAERDAMAIFRDLLA
jgi:hypothetical protein